MKPRAPARAEISAHTLNNAVKIGGAVYYQPPAGGPKQVLISAGELNELRVTQDFWIRDQQQKLAGGSGDDSARNDGHG